MSNIDTEPFPRFALIAAAVLIVGAISAAAAARYADVTAPAAQTETAAPLAARDLTFADMADGSVQVHDTGGALIYVAPPGGDGFIRGVMRGMARDRRARGIGQAPAFRLAQWPDGRLSLEDLATGRQIELGGFGDTNRAAFAQLLGPPAEGAS
ncbi:MAG: photosynthetic complex assembly protein PuhC [Hyphomonadaceae bacterium]